jgi:hypothetical protein
VLQSVLDKKAAGRLCRCIEDAQSAMAAGAPVLSTLSALLLVPLGWWQGGQPRTLV